MTKKGVRGCPSPDKTLAFCLKGTSTFFDRKMRSRRRLWLRLTQAACKRVSSSCTLYEVFGNFAWRSAPPRKRVTQSEKAPALRDREVPPRKRRRGARRRGNGDRGTCLTEGESFTPPLAGLILFLKSKFDSRGKKVANRRLLLHKKDGEKFQIFLGRGG